MTLADHLVVMAAKAFGNAVRWLRLGAGATWPGEIALFLRPGIAGELSRNLRKGIILVAGTNGKTTTAAMITSILKANAATVVHNDSGANLLNGVVSALIQKSHADWGVFEVDENSLGAVISHFKFLISNENRKKKLVIVLLNLFRDQLDRYGEVDVIVEKWEEALKSLDRHASQNLLEVHYVLNADDPGIAYLGAVNSRAGLELKTFGLNEPGAFLKTKEHATDSAFCLHCGSRLLYEGIYYSHIGVWKCARCGARRQSPNVDRWDSPLPGLYNRYNTLAAVATALSLGIDKAMIHKAMAGFAPAFGRQEEFEVDGKKVKIFLSKNPAGFNASLRTVLELGGRALLLVLNDRIPDGRDVSWIWDVDFEMIPKSLSVIVSGDRVYDLALRVEYSRKSPVTHFKSQTHSKILDVPLCVEPKLKNAIKNGLKRCKSTETLYILPTYSAMLEVRKIITGRKIL